MKKGQYSKWLIVLIVLLNVGFAFGILWEMKNGGGAYDASKTMGGAGGSGGGGDGGSVYSGYSRNGTAGTANTGGGGGGGTGGGYAGGNGGTGIAIIRNHR